MTLSRDVIFAIASDVSAQSRRSYAEHKAQAEAFGRNPDHMSICIPVLTIVAESKLEAEDKKALLDDITLEVDQLSLLAEGLNIDFATGDHGKPMAEEDIASISGFQGIRDLVIQASGTDNPTLRDFLLYSQRGSAASAIVGNPKQVADRLEEFFEARVCDGLVVAASHVPGGYADFVKYVVPELQRRGLYHKEYAGKTLRENLGLERPALGSWR